jgi:hypothetical protein
MNITQNHIAEFSALAISIIYWKDIKKGNYRWLPFFLLFILLVELTGNYFRKVPYANAQLYNFTIPLEYLFYLFLFWLHGGKILKPFSKSAALFLALIALFYLIKLPLIILHSYVLITGQAFVIISCCIYIYEQFKSSIEDSLLKNYFFWLCAGLFLFNLGDFTYFALYPIIHENKWDTADFLFSTINHSLLLLLYLSYIVSIIAYKKYKSGNAG